jgi:hypothetical protein
MSYAFSICHVDNLGHQNGCALWTRNRELIAHGLSDPVCHRGCHLYNELKWSRDHVLTSGTWGLWHES